MTTDALPTPNLPNPAQTRLDPFPDSTQWMVGRTAIVTGGGSSGDVAGVGYAISRLFARHGARVAVVDRNAEAAGVTITSHNVHTEEFLKKFDEKPDLIVLDPPRSGLGQAVTAKLAELRAPEIVYLSCDPSTLARDLAVLLQTKRMPTGAKPNAPKYEIGSIQIFDLFPQTYHIETLVHLRLCT